MQSLYELLPSQWKAELRFSEAEIACLAKIDQRLSQEESFNPNRESIFRALTENISEAKVLILGQDPYPNPVYATGLAFSVPNSITVLPASLRNIFQELSADIGIEIRTTGDLSDWQNQGVVLLNRTLTVRSGISNSHSDWGWNLITNRIIEVLARNNCIGVLWGRTAQEASAYFSKDYLIQSPHPSPLSARTGFFGSKPFSRVNTMLNRQGKAEINWG
jgi:uracil-DNA glycosylase